MLQFELQIIGRFWSKIAVFVENETFLHVIGRFLSKLLVFFGRKLQFFENETFLMLKG